MYIYIGRKAGRERCRCHFPERLAFARLARVLFVYKPSVSISAQSDFLL